MRSRSALRGAIAAPALLVLLLTGCSAQGGPAGPATGSGGAGASAPAMDDPVDDPTTTDADGGGEARVPDDPCSLLTTQEATEAYGGSITTTDAGDTGCAYSGPSTGFLLDFSTTEADLAWTVGVAGLKAQAGSAPELAGVGDRAVGTRGTVVVQQGGTVFLITAAHDGQDPDASKAAAVARVVAGRL